MFYVVSVLGTRSGEGKKRDEDVKGSEGPGRGVTPVRSEEVGTNSIGGRDWCGPDQSLVDRGKVYVGGTY